MENESKEQLAKPGFFQFEKFRSSLFIFNSKNVEGGENEIELNIIDSIQSLTNTSSIMIMSSLQMIMCSINVLCYLEKAGNKNVDFLWQKFEQNNNKSHLYSQS